MTDLLGQVEGYSLWVPSRNSSRCFVPTLRDACWQKHLLRVIWQPAISPRQTAEREQTGLQRCCCEGIREWKKTEEHCAGIVFLGLQIFLKESKGKRHKKNPHFTIQKTIRGKGCAKSTAQKGLGYLNIDWWGLFQAWDCISSLAADS